MEMQRDFEIISTDWCPAWSKLEGEAEFRDMVLSRVDKRVRLDEKRLTEVLKEIFEERPDFADLTDEMERLNGENACNYWLTRELEAAGWRVKDDGFIYVGTKKG